MHDEPQTGRPRDSINDETIACVPTLFTENRRFTISNIYCEMVERYLTQTSCTIIFCILTEELEMKVSAR